MWSRRETWIPSHASPSNVNPADRVRSWSRLSKICGETPWTNRTRYGNGSQPIFPALCRFDCVRLIGQYCFPLMNFGSKPPTVMNRDRGFHLDLTQQQRFPAKPAC
jgi:hypothetical protein